MPWKEVGSEGCSSAEEYPRLEEASSQTSALSQEPQGGVLNSLHSCHRETCKKREILSIIWQIIYSMLSQRVYLNQEHCESVTRRMLNGK